MKAQRKPRRWIVVEGDCVVLMSELEENSVDSIVTDPPYGLKFMGKDWDDMGHGSEQQAWHYRWAVEALRVLKPGGHLLAFGGTRTYHRLVSAIEDAGFEIRDQIQWLYGTGFPKSHNISKAVDKTIGVEGAYGAPKSAAHAGWIERGRMRGSEGHEGYQRPWMDDKDAVDKAARKYEPASPEAVQWEGWGTALKPAHEPIVVARKPFKGTVARNVLEYEVGGLNIDACRIEYESHEDKASATPQGKTTSKSGALAGATEYGGCDSFAPDTLCPEPNDRDICTSCFYREIDHRPRTEFERPAQTGRWPANVILDKEAGAMLDEQIGNRPVAKTPSDAIGSESMYRPNQGGYQKQGFLHQDSGGPSRYFYCPKASKSEREAGLEPSDDKRANTHPTVKPISLMEYLIRLITPPDGLVLDPFVGSGTTGIAALSEGFRFTGFEVEEKYVELSQSRIRFAVKEMRQK